MKKLIFILVILFLTPVAFAIDLPVGLAGKAIDESLKTVMNNLESIAFKILFALSCLQFVISGYGMLVAGEIDASLGKFAKMFVWVGFCVWLLSPSGNSGGLSNAGYFIQSSVDRFIAMAGSWSATKGSSFNTTDIMVTGINAYGKITASVAKTTATNAVNAVVTLFVPGVALLTLMMTFAISMVVLVTSAYIALKVFMVKMELAIIVAIAPLSLSLLGLTALRDQGFAPFKSMLALIYRIVVLGAVVSAMGTISQYLSDYVDAQAYGLMADVWSPLIGAAFGFVLLAFVAHKSDSIAASLANGSAALGSSDITSAAAAGAAAGLAVASGGAAMAAMKPAASMGDFMKSMGGDGGGGLSVSNGGGMGSGRGGGGDVQGNAFNSVGDAPPQSQSQSSETTAQGDGDGAGQQAKPPQPKSTKSTDSELARWASPPMQNAIRAQEAATAAGASRQVAKAAGDAAFDKGGSPQKIQAATLAAGGTQQQAEAAAASFQPGPGDAGGRDATIGSNSNSPVAPAPAQQETHLQKALRHAGDFGRHVSNEKAATHVSINTHHSD